VRMDANYVTLLVNVLCIEGLGRQMMPEYNILDSAKPMLEAHRVLGTRKLSGALPKSPAIRLIQSVCLLMFAKFRPR
jgi:aarF domain-containing kinase